MRALRLAVLPAVLLAAACHRGPSDAEATEVVRRYDSLLVEAFRSGDFRVLQPVVGPDELRRVAAHVGVKLDQGITLDARLVEFRVEGVERRGDEIVVRTEERWHYLDRRVGSGEQVGQDSRDHYRMRYFLRQAGKAWVVDRTEFAEKPEVGRTQVPDRAPANVFHGMEGVKSPEEKR